MKKNNHQNIKITSFIASLTLFLSTSLLAENILLDVDLTPTAKIQPTMYGIFFEDINFAADGGLYGELVKNRSFEFAQPMMGWTQPDTDPYSANENSGIANTINFEKNKTNKNIMRVNVFNDKKYSLVNEGFRGIGIRKGETYRFSFYAANPEGGIKRVIAQLVDASGKVIADTAISTASKDWQDYTENHL
jgi:alpha-N-arabinofuranosidase